MYLTKFIKKEKNFFDETKYMNSSLSKITSLSIKSGLLHLEENTLIFIKVSLGQTKKKMFFKPNSRKVPFFPPQNLICYCSKES